MTLIDTHTHLYVDEFKEDIEEVMRRAEAEQVKRFFLPAIDSSQTEAMYSLEKRYPQKIFLMAGLHPCSVRENFREELHRIDLQLSSRSFAAIGESGLDFYWDTSFVKEQYQSLHQHAKWALQYNLPLVLHTRNAMQETIETLKSYRDQHLRGVFHCFSGSAEEARMIIDLGFFLGIGGVVTFKNSGLAEVVKEIPMDYLVLETDSPYLAPVPFRGKRNESSYLKWIAVKIAEIKKISVEEVAEETTKTAMKLFS